AGWKEQWRVTSAEWRAGKERDWEFLFWDGFAPGLKSRPPKEAEECEARNQCRMRHATGISPLGHVQWECTVSAGERDFMRHFAKLLMCSALLVAAAALMWGPQFAS